jgi:hypothetical protein
LLHNYEFAAFVVCAGLAQKAGQLQRKRYGAIHVLMETVEIPAFIMQQQGRCPRLSILRANVEEVGMRLGKNLRQTESVIPLVGDWDQVRIAMLAQLLDDRRQGIVKVFIISAAKAIAGHDDMTAECLRRGINVHEVFAFGGSKERRS